MVYNMRAVGNSTPSLIQQIITYIEGILSGSNPDTWIMPNERNNAILATSPEITKLINVLHLKNKDGKNVFQLIPEVHDVLWEKLGDFFFYVAFDSAEKK